MACEDYKKIKSPVKMAEKAKKIYEEFIQAEAPKEVGPDGKVGECGQLNNFPGRISNVSTLCSHRLFLFESGPPFVSAYWVERQSNTVEQVWTWTLFRSLSKQSWVSFQ